MIRKYLRIALLLLLFAGLIWGLLILRNPQIFPINNVEVKATYQHINPQDLQRTIAPYTTNSFFNLNVSGLKQAILKLPWIYAVSIRRIWPDEVMIQVAEQKAIARWNDKSLLNVNAKIFIPNNSDFPNDLPSLSGSDNQVEKVWQYYLQINKQLTRLNLNITKINLSPNGTWHLLLNNGINVYLSGIDVMRRIDLFIKSYPKVISAKENRVKNVDLRYNEGLAVKWEKDNK